MKRIKFISVNKRTTELEPAPKPAKTFVPDWFRHTPKYKSNNVDSNDFITFIKSINSNDKLERTYKNCLPFVDAMTSGYMVTLPCTVVITQEETPNGLTPFIQIGRAHV